MTSPALVLRRRRALAAHADRRHLNAGLTDAARDLRRRAAAYLAAGRPDLADPYIAEAEVFEDATRPLPAL